MFSLMQNELQRIPKQKMLLIWLGAVSAISIITGIILMGLANDGRILSLVAENTDYVVMGNQSEDVWLGWPIVAAMFGTLFTKATFLIFEGFLISSVIVDEFKNRTINQLFSYPIKRSLIIWSKVLVVVLVAFVAIYSAQIAIHAIIKFTAIFTGHDFNLAFSDILELGISSIGITLVGLIPMIFGMIKYSSVGTMVSSVVVAILICNAFPGTLAANLINSTPFTLISSVISLLLVSITVSAIAKNDVL